jgi:hypothetical protein
MGGQRTDFRVVNPFIFPYFVGIISLSNQIWWGGEINDSRVTALRGRYTWIRFHFNQRGFIFIFISESSLVGNPITCCPLVEKSRGTCQLCSSIELIRSIYLYFERREVLVWIYSSLNCTMQLEMMHARVFRDRTSP